jgi:hypothetical protein
MVTAHRDGGTEKLPLSGFELFDLSVNIGPGFVPWISAASRLGHVHGIPRHDPDLPPLADLLDSVYDFVDAVRFAERDSLLDLRRALGQLVFGEPEVMELFQATRGVAADHGHEMLVRILASPHFAALPWELLPDPGKSHSESEGAFLALAPDVSVVRLARGRTYPIRTDSLEPPLNLLVVLSSPSSGREPSDDSLSFDIYEEKRSLLAELQPLVDAGLLRIDVEDQPTLQNLRRRIGGQRAGYHLFHYIGHAEPDRLILEDESGRREDQSASSFMEVLRLCPDLRLAVFAGCETARASQDPLSVDAATADDWRHILSLADRCVQESCPVVVGMQAVLAFRTERLFTRYFYQGIASGYSVAGAMRLARTATRGDRHVGGDLLDWSVPVLFVGGADPGPLLDRSSRGVPPERPARHVLRLGLRQQETRFFARDVALRQTIDVLSGKTPERVLALTGPAEVGKSTLIDRALEEIDGPVSILYVRLEDLDPKLVFSGHLRQEQVAELAEMKAEAALEKLCLLIAELLTREDGRRHDPQRDQTPLEWWVRLIEEFAYRRLVLVIDDIDALGKLEKELTKRVTEFWLRRQIEQARHIPGNRPLSDLLDDLVSQARHIDGYTQMPGVEPNPLISGLRQLEEWLGGYSQTVRDCVSAEAELSVRYFDSRIEAESTSVKREELDREEEQEQQLLRAAAARLADTRRVLNTALCQISERRTGVRLGIVADKLPDKLLDLPSSQRFVMRLARLTWFETWRWIRRNLPGLLRFGEAYLEPLWPRLGAKLELWEELERRILEPGTASLDIPKLVDQIAPRRPFGRNYLPGYDNFSPRGERPLRVAIAGPHIKSADALAHAITRLATENGVGGRVVAGQEDERGSLAVLIDVPSPFRGKETVAEADIIRFLGEVSDYQPDIVVLDYGYSIRLPLPDSNAHERPLLGRLHHQVLLIAAGGNESAKRGTKEATAPGVYPEVLAVGSIDSVGQLQPYAEWIPALRKPDIFMRDQLGGTALEGALNKDALHGIDDSPLGPGTHGSSFAAIHAVAAAILVWSTLPNLTPDGVRDLLCRASWPVDARSKRSPRALTVQAAVAEARLEVIRQTLKEGPCALQTLAAITGLEPWLVSTSLDVLLSEGEIRRLTRGRLERYELIPQG